MEFQIFIAESWVSLFQFYIKVDSGNIMVIHVKQCVQIKYKLYQYNIGSPDTKCRLNLTCTNKKTSADLKNVNRLRNTQVFTSLKYSQGFMISFWSASLTLFKIYKYQSERHTEKLPSAEFQTKPLVILSTRPTSI